MPSTTEEIVQYSPSQESIHELSLAEIYRNSAKRFLKSAIIIDNEAYIGAKPNGSRNPIDVGVVTKKFAEHGINCSVYRPDIEDKEFIKNSLNLVKQSDAAILDWQLRDDNGDCCIEIIYHLLHEDESYGNAVRIITIYTAETPSIVKRRLKEELEDYGLEDLEAKYGFGFWHQDKLIVILKKKPEDSPREPSEKNKATRFLFVRPSILPDIIIEFFSILTTGLIPSITLHAISAIRENAPNILGAFNKNLDKAFVLHSLLIPKMQDSKSFISGIISDEIERIISNDQEINKIINRNVCRSIIDSECEESEYKCIRCNGTGVIKIKEKADNTEICPYCNGISKWDVTPDSIISLIDDADQETNTAKKHIVHMLYNGASKHENRGATDFCRITYLASEHETSTRKYTRNNPPTLQQGTIVQDTSNVPLICIIPSCDAVRIDKKNRLFPFLRCSYTNYIHEADYVVQIDDDLKYITLPKAISWKKITAIFFTDEDIITAKIDKNQKYIFKSCDKDQNRKNFTWIADLRPHHAVKLATDCMPYLGRVGIDDVEWLRRLKTS